MGQNMQFTQISSQVDSNFWSQLARLKLHEWKLGTHEIGITGGYSRNRNTLSVTENSFQGKTEEQVAVEGILVNCDSIEQFKLQTTREELFNKVASRMWDTIVNSSADLPHGQAVGENAQSRRPTGPQSDGINQFGLLTYVDIKLFKFYYWFCFPTFEIPINVTAKLTLPMDLNIQSQSHLVTINSLTPLENQSHAQKTTVACVDPSNTHPAWSVQNSLLFLAGLGWPDATIVLLRDVHSTANSSVLKVQLPCLPAEMPQAAGWEKNSKGILGPRIVNLANLLDPKQIAANAINLNLNLMKWRLAPDLNLDRIANTSCLIVGAGTVGCNVARNLLGWNVHNVTFIDSGKVSHSNPVRQPLYHLEDVGKDKALVAAEMLKRINPSVNATGHVLDIPMPGHPTQPSTKQAVDTLDTLIQQHDLIFLGTDTRESRWLPTVQALMHGKAVINIALGFDSFLVMRHPVGTLNVGCYFCGDVVAPRDSTLNLSLDQQCTVTRPGIAVIASGFAVEMFVAAVSHSDGFQAENDASGTMGSVPHIMRFWMNEWRNLSLLSERFSKCVACAEVVVEKCREWEFLSSALEDPELLEHVSGAKGVQEVGEHANVDWEDEDDF